MNYYPLRIDEPPVRLIALQIYQDNFMKKKKWRHVAGALIESSKHGRARLEIFNTEEGLNATKILTESTRHLKLQLRDGSSVSLRADNVFALRTQLSRLAFPTQFVTLSRPFSLDSPSTPTDRISFDNLLPAPVLLLQTVECIQEGSYVIIFGEERLELRREEKITASFEYEYIHWIASGDYCFGFETSETYLLYEFKCTHPQQIIDNYRKKCKFRSHFHPTIRPTINHYLRFYYPEMLCSGESTLFAEAKNSPITSSLMASHALLTESSKGSSQYEEIAPHQIRNVRFAPVVKTEINPKAKNKIVGFFKNISPFSKSPPERSAFEQRANSEFRLSASRRKGKNQSPRLATVIRYTPDTLQRSIENNHQIDRPSSMPNESVEITEISGTEPHYSPIPLAIANSPLDPTITTLVSHLAPASRVSLASAAPSADAARVSRVEILQSTYID